MKKTYQSPASSGIDMQPENMLATSNRIGLHETENFGASNALNNRYEGGWNAEDWSDSKE